MNNLQSVSSKYNGLVPQGTSGRALELTYETQIPHYKNNIAYRLYINYIKKPGDSGYDPYYSNCWTFYKNIQFKEVVDMKLKQERAASGNITFITLSDELGKELHDLNDVHSIMIRRLHEGEDEFQAINNIYYMIDSQYSSTIDDSGFETIQYSFDCMDINGILNQRKLRNNVFYPESELETDDETGEIIYPSNYMQYYKTQAQQFDEVMITREVMALALEGYGLNPGEQTYLEGTNLYGVKNIIGEHSPAGIWQTCGTDCGEKSVLAFLADSNWRTALFHYIKDVSYDPNKDPIYQTEMSIVHSEDLATITMDYDKSLERPQLFTYNKTKSQVISACFVRGNTPTTAYEVIDYDFMPVPFEAFSSNTDDSDPQFQAEEKLRTNQTYVNYDLELAFEDKLPFVDFFVGTKVILLNVDDSIDDVTLYIRQIDEQISGDDRQVIIKLEEPPVF